MRCSWGFVKNCSGGLISTSAPSSKNAILSAASLANPIS